MFTRFSAVFLIVLVLTACTVSGLPQLKLAGAAGTASAGDGFTQTLARGYRMLAEYEMLITMDQDAAARYAAKAQAATEGREVEVENPAFFKFPDDADDGELEQARRMFLDARGVFAQKKGGNATQMAEAQVNYDCWLFRAAATLETAQGCREKFYEAVGHLESDEIRHFAITFGYNTATPDAAAFAAIRLAAASFTDRPDWRIHITGHGDASRDKHANLILSMRRAVAVRNSLMQNGVDIDKIVLGAIGAGKARSTGSEKTDESRRRVDVSIIPVSMDKPDDGPDIKAIVPNYFGNSRTAAPGDENF